MARATGESAQAHSVDQWAALLLAVVLASVGLLPLWPGDALRPHDLQRAVQCGLLCVCTLTFAVARIRCFCPDWVAVAFWSCVLVAIAQSAYPGVAAQEFALWLGLAGVAGLASGCRAESLWVLITRGLVLGASLYAVVVLGLFVVAVSDAQPLHSRSLCLGFDNPRFLNHCQTVLLPWVAWCSLNDPARRWRVLALAAAAVHVALAILGLARATGVAWAAVVLVLLLLGQWRLARRTAACLACGLACGLVLFYALPWLLDQRWIAPFSASAELGSDHSRWGLWQRAWQMFVSAPWFGVGPMHFAAMVNGKAAHPHNVYLQMLAELGGPAVLLGLIWVGKTLFRGLQSLRASDTAAAWLPPAYAAVVAALVDGCFSGNFVMPLSQLLIAVSFGALLAGLPAAAIPVCHPARWRVARQSLALMLVVSQLGLIVCVLQQAPLDPPRVRLDSPQAGADGTMRPRFWLSGWI